MNPWTKARLLENTEISRELLAIQVISTDPLDNSLSSGEGGGVWVFNGIAQYEAVHL